MSAVAHDLRLSVGTFSILIEDASGAVDASFDPASVTVVCARHDGADAMDTLSGSDKKKIDGNIRDDVLQVRRHAEITFVGKRSSADGQTMQIDGRLRLHGQEKALRVLALRKDGAWVCDVELNQPDFGIKPFTALLGTLRVQAKILVQVEVPV